MLDNKTIYKKTITFSLRRLFWDILSFFLFIGLGAAGYLIAEKSRNKGLVGLAIGSAIALVLIILVVRFVSYRFKAGQIAMMTRGITENELPADVYGEGKKVVKERFATVAAYFAITRVIQGIFSELGRLITRAGQAIGGDTGNAVGSAVSTVIQTVIRYLCDCCLGWVFYRKDIGAGKATCEGAVIFFKHGKTLAKNMGRVFGMGLASLAVIGGVFGGAAYLISTRFPAAFETLSREIAEAAARSGNTNIPDFLKRPETLMIVCAVLVGVIFWSLIHAAFIRPFVLVGVLRNYLNSGMQDMPTEESLRMLDGKSKKFQKLRTQGV